MLENVPGIRRLTIPMGGGLDESSPVTDVSIEDYIELDDWRISRDGKRIQKRYGIAQDTIGFGTEVYGLATYYDSDSAFCELLVNTTTIQRSVGGAAWATVHTFSSPIAHPVDVLEIQGKQFIINEVDSRMIHTDKADYQIGITAPATLPTLTGGYDAALLEEACAALGTWTDGDAGAGASTQVTYDSKSTFRFLNTGNAGDFACRYKYVTNTKMPQKFVVNASVYFNTLGNSTNDDFFAIYIGTGYGHIGLAADSKEYYVINGASWDDDFVPTGIITKQDQWVDIKLVVDGSDPDARFVEIYIDDEYQGKWFYTNVLASSEGLVWMGAYGVTVATDCYVDYINISDAESAKLNGQYRYAITYARGGNFGCESNPIKSLVGAPTITGAGLDDLSAGGVYSGGKDRTIRVRIDGTGTPDTIEVSYDGGNTWHTTDLALPALSPTELVTNGGFASVTTGWAAANSAALESVAGGQAGNCLQITESGENYPYAFQTLDVDPNTHYHLSFYVKNDSETEYQAYIYDETNAAALTSADWLSGTAAWVQHHAAFYTPSNCKSISIFLVSRSLSGEGKTFLFDTVTLYKAYVMYLNYGITLGWGYSTGHTNADYWDFDCDALATRATNQKVTFANIPVSGDAQVDQRKIYRTTADGANYYWLTTINDNTTTAFVDNIPDTALGLLMEEDKAILPNGKFSAWWDNRLWVTGDNVVYYSEIDYPEEFDLLNRRVIVRTGDQQDEITGMKEYGDKLYVFKRNAVFIIEKKAGGGYGRYKIMDGIGCMAGWSIIKVNNVMMWLSDKGVELFNGTDVYSQDFSVMVKRTLADIEKDKLDFITSGHLREFNEVIWSLPDRGASASVFLVYNTIKNRFYRFSQSVDISCINEIEDSGGALRLAVGRRSAVGKTPGFGYMDPSTPVYQDWGAGVITATARKGLINVGKGSQFHGIEVEFESVTDKDLTLNVYLDMDKDVFFTTTLTGVTPSATDKELRRPIKFFAQWGGRETRYVNFEFINADATTGQDGPYDCKINRVDLFFVPKIIKKTQAPD